MISAVALMQNEDTHLLENDAEDETKALSPVIVFEEKEDSLC